MHITVRNYLNYIVNKRQHTTQAITLCNDMRSWANSESLYSRTISVRPSVCLTHAGLLCKRIKLRPRGLHQPRPHHPRFLRDKVKLKTRTERGRQNQANGVKCQF